jgi:hypothetical protein
MPGEAPGRRYPPGFFSLKVGDFALFIVCMGDLG